MGDLSHSLEKMENDCDVTRFLCENQVQGEVACMKPTETSVSEKMAAILNFCPSIHWTPSRNNYKVVCQTYKIVLL